MSALMIVLITVRRSWTPSTDASAPAISNDLWRAITPACLWDLVIVSLGLSIVVLAATATWPHHAQTLAIPGAFALALVATRLSGVGQQVACAPLLLVAGYATAGALHPFFYLDSRTRRAYEVCNCCSASHPRASSWTPCRWVRTYARAGSNDVSAHAVGCERPRPRVPPLPAVLARHGRNPRCNRCLPAPRRRAHRRRHGGARGGRARVERLCRPGACSCATRV